ncbi:MAG: nucleotidyltransferase domain-containing protein [Burkholderiales bacterium]|nr:nucleotidyltransferase domain-containing protein [Burkholderiales bacterium]
MSKLGNALFSKPIRAILGNVYLRPEGIHLRALMASTGISSASAQRELARLTGAGLLVKENIGRVVLYKANTKSPIYSELNAIIRKTFGVADILKATLLPFQSRIDRAFIYGSVAKGQDTATSDIDLFILSNELGSADLYPQLVPAEEKVGRKISLTVYRPAEFQKKLDSKNHFLVSVMTGPKIELLGEHDEYQGA